MWEYYCSVSTGVQIEMLLTIDDVEILRDHSLQTIGEDNIAEVAIQSNGYMESFEDIKNMKDLISKIDVTMSQIYNDEPTKARLISIIENSIGVGRFNTTLRDSFRELFMSTLLKKNNYTHGCTKAFLERIKELTLETETCYNGVFRLIIRLEIEDSIGLGEFMKINHSSSPHPVLNMTYDEAFDTCPKNMVIMSWDSSMHETIDALVADAESNSGSYWLFILNYCGHTTMHVDDNRVLCGLIQRAVVVPLPIRNPFVLTRR